MSWIDIATALLGILAALALIEISVRVFFPQDESLWVADPYIKTTHRKRATATRSGPEFRITIKTNGQGFVGAEDFTVEKPPHVLRVAALGDSFTEGHAVDWDKAYPFVLERQLRERGINAQVYNFGIAGTGTAHQLLTWRHYITRYRPDVLVWQFYTGNDFLDNILFRAGGAGESRVRFGKLRYFFSRYLEAPRFILHRLAEARKMRDALLKMSLVSPGLYSRDAGRDYPFVWDVYNPSAAPFVEELARTGDLALQLCREAAAQGARVLAVVVPAKEEVYAEDWQKLLKRYPAMAQVRWELEAPRKAILSRLQAAGVETLDLTRVFAARVAEDAPRMYYHEDDHLNEEGQALVAEELAPRIADTASS